MRGQAENSDKNIWTGARGSDRRLEKLHKEELQNFYLSTSGMRLIKSVGMRYDGPVTHIR